MPGVLLVTYHFPPSAASGTFRMLGFAQHLPKHGYAVSVVAPPTMPWEPVDPSLCARVPPQTKVYPVEYPRHVWKGIRWLTPWGIWAWYARDTVARAVREQKPDVVLTSGPPHVVHLLGWDAKRRFGVPWVVDCRDPWVTTTDVNPPKGFKAVYERFWERRVFARADAIVTNAPHAREKLAETLPRFAAKLHSIPNGYDPEIFPPAPTRSPGPIRILHAGELYVGRDPRPILDAVAGIAPGSVPPFRFEFLGRTADLATDAQRRGLSEAIVCRGQVTYRQTLDEMVGADVLLLMDTLDRHIGVPAKLYEYLGAGRPVLATGESGGDLAAVLGESGVPFRIARPNDPAAIRSAVVEMVRGVADHTLPAVRDEARRQFTREALAGRLAALLDTLRKAKS
jgi:glycosyltransferase involved in cell wall biosynthesis